MLMLQSLFWSPAKTAETQRPRDGRLWTSLYDELWWQALQFLEARDVVAVGATGRERMMALARSEVVWRCLYGARFATPSGLQCDETLETSLEKFRQRLRHPTPGDLLEVAWDGSFELELGKVYTGLSWWSCEILEGEPFTVHYPGWPDDWDEVVDRASLRWPVKEGATTELERGDIVEVYCQGTSVPGSWLNSTIVRARPPNTFFVEHVDGAVPRSRLRLVRRPERREWWRADELRSLARDALPESWVDMAPKAESAIARAEAEAMARGAQDDASGAPSPTRSGGAPGRTGCLPPGACAIS